MGASRQDEDAESSCGGEALDPLDRAFDFDELDRLAPLQPNSSDEEAQPPDSSSEEEAPCKQELAPRSDKPFVEVRGALGPHADVINGTYVHVHNSFPPAFYKLADGQTRDSAGALWLYNAENGTWCFGPRESKERGAAICWAFSEPIGWHNPPISARGWQVAVEDDWVAQDLSLVLQRSDCGQQGSRAAGEAGCGAKEEVLTVRMLLDAEPHLVGLALARALVEGQEKFLHDDNVTKGGLRWRGDGSLGLPMPVPMAKEWKDIPLACNQFQDQNVWDGGLMNSSESFSLGLRPLLATWVQGDPPETITPHNGEDGISGGFDVQLASGIKSHYIAERLHQKAKHPKFRVLVTSPILQEILSENLGGSNSWEFDAELSGLPGPYWIACTCEVRPASNGRRAELVRHLLGGSPLVEAFPGNRASGRPDFWNPAILLASRVIFMLEMETRAWLAAQGFPLVEVWRGIRRPIQWAVFSTYGTVGSYTYASGHAAHAASEAETGPRFSVDLAHRLSRILPKHAAEGQWKLQAQFVEGFVDVVTFAEVLDRICRRARGSRADILRRFVDLGSGRGHAVLTAHALLPFRCCIGYELSHEYHEAALAITKVYEDSGLAALARSSWSTSQLFVEGDFLELDWSDASIVFANAVTWPSSLLKSISRQALRLRKGAVFVTATRQLNLDDLEVLNAFDVRGETCLMSFSDMRPVQCWAYQRI